MNYSNTNNNKWKNETKCTMCDSAEIICGNQMLHLKSIEKCHHFLCRCFSHIPLSCDVCFVSFSRSLLFSPSLFLTHTLFLPCFYAYIHRRRGVSVHILIDHLRRRGHGCITPAVKYFNGLIVWPLLWLSISANSQWRNDNNSNNNKKHLTKV